MENKKTLWFTSDQHFGSQRTLELSKRPFNTPCEMDSYIIERFNEKVDDNDYIMHLGDFGDFDRLRELNSNNHYLVLGNYERKEMEEKFNNDFKEYRNYLIERGFKDVFLPGQYKIQLDKHEILKYILLYHEPEECVKEDPARIFNLFGHIHGRQMVKRYGIDVGVDGHHFYPISIQDVKFYYDAIMNHYDSNVFE